MTRHHPLPAGKKMYLSTQLLSVFLLHTSIFFSESSYLESFTSHLIHTLLTLCIDTLHPRSFHSLCFTRHLTPPLSPTLSSLYVICRPSIIYICFFILGNKGNVLRLIRFFHPGIITSEAKFLWSVLHASLYVTFDPCKFSSAWCYSTLNIWQNMSWVWGYVVHHHMDVLHLQESGHLRVYNFTFLFCTFTAVILQLCFRVKKNSVFANIRVELNTVRLITVKVNDYDDLSNWINKLIIPAWHTS